MNAFTLHLQFSDTFSDDLERIVGNLSKKDALFKAVGADLQKDITDHIRTVKVPRQDKGIEFWQQAIDSLEMSTTSTGALLSFEKIGVQLRYFGGEVTPGKGPVLSGPNKGRLTRALSVPTDNAPIKGGSYQRPHEAGLLAFIRKAVGGETVGFLVEGREKIATKGKRKGQRIVVAIPKGQGGRLMYVLRTITRHKPDPTVLPSDAEMTETATNAAAKFLDVKGD